ncbi:MAG: TonB-dependent receptor [Muribaculaceae bacterium]|nr:TonB-dependent receptor [Muribaculaceae bacterium]
MKKTILTLITSSSIAAGLYATVVTGTVLDTDGNPLPGATVKLVNLPDSTDKKLTVCDVDGVFKFSDITDGRYSVNISMIGMDTAERVFTISDSIPEADLGKVVLGEEATMLKETIVTGVKAAVVAKQDTLEFNAGSYKTHPNATVEDLLKKLPGVEVGSDGTLQSNGKTITKVLVNGKEFFNDDTSMATKNLPSDLVDKVQVIDRKSDFSRLTGVDDGEEETVINLTVKKTMENGWLGTISGGYGTDGRYEGSFNVSTFTPSGNQISFVGGANNINDLGFSDSGRGRFMNFGNSGGITTSQRFGVNFNLGKSEKFRVGGNIFYSHSDRDAETFTDKQYLFADSTSNQREHSVSRDKGHNLRADLRMEWKIDDYNTLDFRPRFSFNSRNSSMFDTDTLFAGDPAHSKVNLNENTRYNHGNSYNVGGDLIYNHKFKSRPGRAFSAQVKYEFSDTKQNTTSWNDIKYYLQDDESLLYRFSDNDQWNNSVMGRLTWTEPLGDVARGNFLQFSYRMQYRFNDADKYTYNLPEPENPESFQVADLDKVPAGIEPDATLSNRFRNRFMNQEIRVGYKKVNKDYNLEAGMVVAPSMSKSTDLIMAERNVPAHWVWNVAPYFNMRYKFSKTRSLRVNYRANTSQPSISQLQPVADVSDPLNIVIGNPDLKPTFTQSIGFHYNNYNSDLQQSMVAMLRGSYATNVVVSRTTTDSETGVRTTEYANANGNVNVMGMFMMNQPFADKKWRYSARMMARYNNVAGFINGDFNRSGNLVLSPNVGVTFSSDIFQMTVNPTYSFNMATNSLPQQPNRYTHTYGFTTDASLYLPFGLNISTDLAFDKSTGYSRGFNTTSWLWNAQISYSVLKDKSLTFSVRAYDLLGEKKNISRSVSANMITDSRYNDLTRYVMFGISWKFNTVKKQAKNDTIDGPGDFPGPPPGEGPRGDRPPMGGPGGPGGRRPF